jgi:hypothetical protein
MVMAVPAARLRAPLIVPRQGRNAKLMLCRRRARVSTLVLQALLVVVVRLIATTGVATHGTRREDAALVNL